MSEVVQKLAPNAAKVSFYGIPATNEGGSETIKRMTGFTEAGKSMNPKEYSRQYVDENEERTDVTGYSPSVSYNFDWYVGNAVHEDIKVIHDKGLIGTDAIRNIYVVDMTAEGNSRPCFKRPYSVIPDAESGNGNAYNFSGSFKSNGSQVEGTATSEDNWQTITFAASE